MSSFVIKCIIPQNQSFLYGLLNSLVLREKYGNCLGTMARNGKQLGSTCLLKKISKYVHFHSVVVKQGFYGGFYGGLSQFFVR